MAVLVRYIGTRSMGRTAGRARSLAEGRPARPVGAGQNRPALGNCPAGAGGRPERSDHYRALTSVHQRLSARRSRAEGSSSGTCSRRRVSASGKMALISRMSGRM